MCYPAGKKNNSDRPSLSPLPLPAASPFSLPQVSLSGSMLDIYGGEQGMNAPSGGMSLTPNRTKLTVKREYTGMDSYRYSTDQTTNPLTDLLHILIT